jgi:hypothetical protein
VDSLKITQLQRDVSHLDNAKIAVRSLLASPITKGS